MSVSTTETLALAAEIKAKAEPKLTAEDKLIAMKNAVGGDPTFAKAEKAAETLNKGNKKTLQAWLDVGAAMVRLGEIANGNNRVIGDLIKDFPEFSAIPSPIRSNAKWLAQNYTDGANVAEMIADGKLKGDHPTSLREQFNKLTKDNKPPKGEGAEGEAGEGEGAGGKDADEALAITNFLSDFNNFLDTLDEAGVRKFVGGLASVLAEKDNMRKAVRKVLPKTK